MNPRWLVATCTALLVLLAACSPQPSPAASGSARPSLSVAPSLGSGPSAAPSASVTAWSEVQASGPAPAPREDHTWTVTPDGATAYLFGGRDGDTVFDDLWAYDPAANAWRALPDGGARPVSSYGSCAAIGPDGSLWISHGFTSEGQRFADTRAYDCAAGTWTDETPAGDAPIERCLHACWWTEADAFILYAGQTTGVTSLGDQWRLHTGPRPGTNEWEQLSPSGGLPPDRNLYAAARWGAATLVFGGQGLDGAYLADGWWLNDADGAATRLAVSGAAPPGRAGTELIADPARGRMLLFGGRSEPAAFGDLWQLTLPPG